MTMIQVLSSGLRHRALATIVGRRPVPLLVNQNARSLASALPLPEESPPERPRLQALRQRLSQEDDDVVSLSHYKTSSTTRTAEDNTTATTPSLDSILQQLEHLPSPENVLVDRFQRQHTYLRLSLSERCNLRCQYCMPPEGVPLQHGDALLSRQELITLTKLFVKHGVSKIRLTGGEPLLRRDLVDIVHNLSTLPNITQIGMTTNGVTLSRQLEPLVEAGLTHVNISLDTLRQDTFLELTRRNGLDKVLQSIKHACTALPQDRVKLNCVVMRGINEHELEDFILLSKDFPLDVRFIEWMPFYQNGWNQNRFVGYEEMLQSVQHLSLQRLQDGPNDTTKWYALDNSLGRVGFITSMSQHFCGTCNRLRLTADGKLKACLFGSEEISLRDVLRNDAYGEETLEKLIHYTVQRKTYALGGHGSAENIAQHSDTNRPMTLIGG